MDNRVLSQEEIEILLKGETEKQANTDLSAQDFTSTEKDAIGEIANISMGAAATALSMLLSKKVSITTPQVQLLKSEEIGIEFPDPALMVSVEYKIGVEGTNFFILSQQDCAIIFDLMMGGTGDIDIATELSEIQMSAIAEAMNQMMGSAATSMSSMFNEKVDISPPHLAVADFTKDDELTALLKDVEPLVRISFNLKVEGVIDSILAQVIPLRVVKNMVDKMFKTVEEVKPVVQEQPEKKSETHYEEPQKTYAPQANTRKEEYSNPSKFEATSVQPAQFGQLKPINTSGLVPDNLDLILDVPLQVSVELGKAKKTIQEIMMLGPGAVIELDRAAGEPVDMIVNGKLIAKCEVVVINETFGIRITDIIHPAERLKTVN